MPTIPRERSWESTPALVRDPYRFISRRCREHGSDLFEARLLLKKTVCLSGPAAAELFYDPSRFERAGATPTAVQKTLLGVGGVQGLDDAAHRHRKDMHLSLMGRERIAELVRGTEAEWSATIARWARQPEATFTLYAECQELLTRAVCAWAGVPLPETAVAGRTRELTAMFDQAATLSPGHLWSRWARRRVERWLARVIAEVRRDAVRPGPETAVHVIAWHRDLSDRLLPPRIAAVELANVLRPTVAIAVYLVLVAHALHAHPASAARLRAGEAGFARNFVHEVRRLYPFFPAVAARTRQAFTWQGYAFPANRQVMLDLYGINHDPRVWADPDTFDPDRFRDWDRSAYNFVPQGGGAHAGAGSHRCAGEWITIALMEQAATALATRVAYDVPAQDLELDWRRMPALPRSRFRITGARATALAPGVAAVPHPGRGRE